MEESTTYTYYAAADRMQHKRPCVALLETLVNLDERDADMDHSDADFVLSDLRKRGFACAGIDEEAQDQGSLPRRLRKIFICFDGVGPTQISMLSETKALLQALRTEQGFCMEDIVLSPSEWEHEKALEIHDDGDAANYSADKDDDVGADESYIHNDSGCIHMLPVCLCVIGKAAAATLEPPNKKGKVNKNMPGWTDEHRSFYTQFELKWPPTWAEDEEVDIAFARDDRMKEATCALKQ